MIIIHETIVHGYFLNFFKSHFYYERSILLLFSRMTGLERFILYPHKGNIISTFASSDLYFGFIS